MSDPNLQYCQQLISNKTDNFSRAICLTANHSISDIINHFQKYPQYKKHLTPEVASKIHHPESMTEKDFHIARAAFLKKNIWDNGHTLRIAFLNGSDDNKSWVQQVINNNFILKKSFIHINLDWDVPPQDSDIRIYFDPALMEGKMGNSGSWSLIGTEVLDQQYDSSLPIDQPPNATIHYSWLDQTEDNTGSAPDGSAIGTGAVVIHEFGHALGMIHEHQRSDTGIVWNKQLVYCYFEGPPNDWDQSTVDENVFQTYDISTLNASAYDPKSIMEYYYPPSFFIQGPTLAYNVQLSDLDMEWLGKVYPGGSGKIMGNVIIGNSVSNILYSPITIGAIILLVIIILLLLIK